MYNKLINSFLENKDQEKAVKMAAYMKNNFSFLGIPKPLRAKLEKEFIKAAKKQRSIDWDLINKLWNMPEREFQYLAVDYLLALKDCLQKNDIDNVRSLIINKSWWDTVDILAGNITGVLCLKHPELINSHMLKWAESDNVWLIRTSILYQLRYKGKTDAALLGLIIKQNSESKEFFINKAIGWALREYSKTNKIWVKEFIESNTLSPLSVREGSKYL
ncbi:MAG: DNA alkylation repair protein [Firmicutes bacterium]|nr:DNA alkylation repair protein [Bacillota bacterium]